MSAQPGSSITTVDTTPGVVPGQTLQPATQPTGAQPVTPAPTSPTPSPAPTSPAVPNDLPVDFGAGRTMRLNDMKALMADLRLDDPEMQNFLRDVVLATRQDQGAIARLQNLAATATEQPGRSMPVARIPAAPVTPVASATSAAPVVSAPTGGDLGPSSMAPGGQNLVQMFRQVLEPITEQVKRHSEVLNEQRQTRELASLSGWFETHKDRYPHLASNPAGAERVLLRFRQLEGGSGPNPDSRDLQRIIDEEHAYLSVGREQPAPTPQPVPTPSITRTDSPNPDNRIPGLPIPGRARVPGAVAGQPIPGRTGPMIVTAGVPQPSVVQPVATTVPGTPTGAPAVGPAVQEGPMTRETLKADIQGQVAQLGINQT